MKVHRRLEQREDDPDFLRDTERAEVLVPVVNDAALAQQGYDDHRDHCNSHALLARRKVHTNREDVGDHVKQG
jgi:hypothetical protein